MDAMSAIKNKIRSNRGASITFALMIFMVCTVISATIIVAATTAAGRLSTMEEMDERYYLVTDACELLCNIFDGKKVVVACTKDEDGNSSYSYDPNTANTILKAASIEVVRKANVSIPSEPVEKTVEGTDGKEYICKIIGTLQNGTLTFDVSASGGTTNNGAYKLSVIFASNVKYPVADSTETTSKATVTWKLRSIRKNKAITTEIE